MCIRDRLEEQLAACRLLWGDGAAEFSGEHVSFSESICAPKPLKSVPILIGGESDHTLRRIARLADGWLPRARHGFDASLELARFSRIAEAEGRDPKTLTTNLFGAPANPSILEGYRAAGVDRAIIILRSAPADQVRQTVSEIAGELKASFLQ